MKDQIILKGKAANDFMRAATEAAKPPLAPAPGSVPINHLQELMELERRFFVSVREFLLDWRKGDFELPSLAVHDAEDMEVHAIAYSEKMKLCERLHIITGEPGDGADEARVDELDDTNRRIDLACDFIENGDLESAAQSLEIATRQLRSLAKAPNR